MNDNRIEFPKNDKVALKNAIKYLGKGQTEKAYDVLARLYKKSPSKTHTLYFFRVLYEMRYKEECIDLAERHEEWFLKGNLYTYWYIDVLIQDNQFVKAKALIMRTKKLSNKELTGKMLDQLNNQLNDTRLRFEKEMSKKEDTVTKQLYSIASLQPLEQIDLLSESEHFTNKKVYDAYKNMLVNPYASEVAKTIALNHMLKLSDELIEIDWFREKKQVSLKELESIDNHHTIVDLQQMLENKLQDNPSLLGLVSQELTIHLTLLYPFIDDVITNNTAWLNLYLNKYDFNIKPNSQRKDEKMVKWFKRLSEYSYN